MTALKPTRLNKLVTLPRAERIAFGTKTAGNARLLELRPGSPFAYDVLDDFGIAPPVNGTATRAELREVFGDLTHGLTTMSVLMARSSGLREDSTAAGSAPTLCSRFDPAHREASFAHFARNVETVRAFSNEMGVHATVMAGRERRIHTGQRAFGYDLLSFVADSHEPTYPPEVTMNFAHGLGTRAVARDGDAIMVNALRASGLFTFFGNADEKFWNRACGSIEPVQSADNYRQHHVDFFDLERDVIATGNIDPEFFSAGTDPLPDELTILEGELFQRVSYEADAKATAILRRIGGDHLDPRVLNRGSDGVLLGITPFQNHRMPGHLIGILRYLAEHGGPVQIEGAFLNRNTLTPRLFQHLPVPLAATATPALTIEHPHLRTDRVIGGGEFRGPLVTWIPTSAFAIIDVNQLAAIDQQFKTTGYILFITPQHTQAMVSATPHCHYRLTNSSISSSSHAATATRGKQGAVLASRVAQSPYDLVEFVLPPDERRGPFAIYRTAHLQANGVEGLALSIEPSPPAPPPTMWQRLMQWW